MGNIGSYVNLTSGWRRTSSTKRGLREKSYDQPFSILFRPPSLVVSAQKFLVFLSLLDCAFALGRVFPAVLWRLSGVEPRLAYFALSGHKPLIAMET
jgi:hypothetical protein